jgi:hypothetical protein
MDRPLDRALPGAAVHDGNGRFHLHPVEEPSIGELFKRLSADASHLVQQEIGLAKAELGETARRLGRTAAKLAVAAGIAIPGALAITAFLVIALGDAIGSYWAGALIVGAALLGTAAIMVRRALRALREEPIGAPTTAQTLREDARWAKEQLRTFRREVTA